MICLSVQGVMVMMKDSDTTAITRQLRMLSRRSAIITYRKGNTRKEIYVRQRLKIMS